MIVFASLSLFPISFRTRRAKKCNFKGFLTIFELWKILLEIKNSSSCDLKIFSSRPLVILYNASQPVDIYGDTKNKFTRNEA